MKIMVISDIHGGSKYLEIVLEKYKQENADRLFILGDFCGYFNSFNDYEVAELLNDFVGEICAVRGNCDNESIEKMLNFGLVDIRHVNLDGKIVTLTHGHIYNKYNLPQFCGDILLTGHTHYGMINKTQDRIFANPGSISRPRNNSERSYLMVEEDKIILKNLEGRILIQESIK